MSGISDELKHQADRCRELAGIVQAPDLVMTLLAAATFYDEKADEARHSEWLGWLGPIHAGAALFRAINGGHASPAGG